jgi:peptidoglycan/LPS O-acetylase OafA/YrhL
VSAAPPAVARRDRGHTTAPSGRYGYQPALDGVRAFAVLAVLLYHGGQRWAVGGFLGVDAFFVLSGFLITTLLVTEWGAKGRIDVAAFWVRRAKRLLPALGLVIVGIACYAVFFAPSAQVGSIRGDGIASLFYAANWKFVFSGQSYFDQFAQPSPFRHMWSLAIEEQFYLIWPLVVFGVLWFTRSLRWLLGVCLALIAGSAVLMAVLYTPGADPSRVYYGTDTRAQSLLMGAVAAVLVYRHGPIRSYAARVAVRVAAAVGAVSTLWLWWQMGERTDTLYRGGFVLASLAVVCVIVSVTQPERGALGRFLSITPLRWIGMISYGLYLWHWPVYLTLTTTRTGLDGTALLLVRLAVSVAFAVASYFLVERPIRLGTLRLPRPVVAIPALGAALVLALVLTTTGGGPSLALDTVRSLDASPAPPPPPAPAQAPSADSAANEFLLDGAAAAAPPVAVPPTRVMVAGDSIAASLGLGLVRAADASDGKLVVWNKGTLGCGMLRYGVVDIGSEPFEQPATCNDWDTRWLQPIAEYQPNVVVLLTGAWDVLDREIDGTYYSPGSVPFDRYFLDELDRATALLGSQGAKVVVLTTPFLSRPDLVGQAEGSWPEYEPWRIDRVNALYRDFATAHPGRYTLIDLNGHVAPNGKYTQTLGATEIFDDGVHFGQSGSDFVSAWLVPQLDAVVAGVGVTAVAPEQFDQRKLRAE